ncbi:MULTISPECIES: preprotein translocase, SecE subunit domain protein [Enterococcus]|nr:preprotein translocase, SecE subunit domain protein [Enterococcus casseliflavus]
MAKTLIFCIKKVQERIEIMALKGGRIFQEMIEVPDEKEKGCGCIGWIVLLVIVITILIHVLDFVFQHLFISFLFVAGIVFVINLFNKR